MASEELRRKFDNPLVFIVLITIGVAGLMKVGQWGGTKLGWNGMSNYFGSK